VALGGATAKRRTRTPHVLTLPLQVRTRTLDGTLRPLFERWYPGLANDNAANAEQTA